ALPVSVQIDGARGGQQSPVEARQPSLLDPGPVVPDLEPPAEPKHQPLEPPGRGSGQRPEVVRTGKGFLDAQRMQRVGTIARTSKHRDVQLEDRKSTRLNSSHT